MARLARLYAPSIVQHVAQRPAHGRTLFVDDEDYHCFTSLLDEMVRAHGVALHAYALLPAQVRFLATPAEAGSIARLMQGVGRRYVTHANRRAGRVGPLWDRRYRSTLIDADVHLLASMRYIEQCPVRSDLATTPPEWRWSSVAHHVGLEQQARITDHALYWALSDTPFERQAIWRGLVDTPVAPELGQRIEQAVDHGWILGDAAFVDGLHRTLNRRGMPLRRGRPSRPTCP